MGGPELGVTPGGGETGGEMLGVTLGGGSVGVTVGNGVGLKREVVVGVGV